MARPSGLEDFGVGFRGGCAAALSVEEQRCLVDEDSDQPAFERSFVFERRRVARGGEPAVSDGAVGEVDRAEDAAGDELKHLMAAREPLSEGICVPLLVWFEVGADIRNADLLIAFRGGREEITGSVSHEHHFLSQLGLL